VAISMILSSVQNTQLHSYCMADSSAQSNCLDAYKDHFWQVWSMFLVYGLFRKT